MPSLTFMVGKGGVGKTTVAAAYAIWRAESAKHKVLLLSTDPAHSLADVLGTSLSNRARRIKSFPRLFAREIGPRSEVSRFLEKQREGILSLVESGTLFSRDEVEPLLDATLPGMSEIAALLAVNSLLDSSYDEIVVDTAPMGHTLRLFDMPAHFATFVEFLEVASSRDRLLARRFGGSVQAVNPSIIQWRHMVGRIQDALSHSRAELVLVSSPEAFSLNESVRARDYLLSGDTGLEFTTVVLNRATTAVRNCSYCRSRATLTRKATRLLKREFSSARVLIAEEAPRPIGGNPDLLALGRHIFGSKKLKLPAVSPPKALPLKFARVDWPRLDTELTLTVGKGGVGKTTFSASLAFQQLRLGSEPVTVCSTDPAPSLADVFQTDVGDYPKAVLDEPGLGALEVDSMAEYERWAESMRARISSALSSEQRGLHLDLSFDRELLLALLDVVPPGVDEIFALFRILELLQQPGKHNLVIDMAPTGHALELLRTPERILAWCRLLLKTLAAHRTLPFARDAAVEVATISQRVRELAAIFASAKRAQFYVVMLAEPLPDRETGRLLSALRDLSAPLAGVVINRVRMRTDADCRYCRTAQRWQLATIANTVAAGTVRLFLPEFSRPISGKSGLEQMSLELWELA